MDIEENAKKRSVWAKLVDVLMLIGSVPFFILSIYAYSNGIIGFLVFGLGLFHGVVIFIAVCRLLFIKREDADVIYKAGTVFVYVVNTVLIPVLLLILGIGGFHDKRIDDPKRYNKNMFYGDIRYIAPEDIPENAQNIELYYGVINFFSHDEVFLQYSLPPREYKEVKGKILSENKEGGQSEFFKDSYDVDIGGKDYNNGVFYAYDFVSFCDDEYIVRFVFTISEAYVKPYFKERGEEGMNGKE